MNAPPATARVIPVMDLMDGAVVRAQRGDRASYRPIVTPLARGSDPVDIAQALLARCPAPAGEPPLLYVADLDALTGGAMQAASVRRLLGALPDLRLWLDAGVASVAAAAELRAGLGPQRVQMVIASESLADARELPALAAEPQAILSLDCRQARPMDRAGVWLQPACWPDTVIVMTLDRVGADVGPDFETLAQLQARARSAAGSPRPRRWVGAGGLRDARDLAAAAASGAWAWLVASALHDGRLDPRQLA